MRFRLLFRWIFVITLMAMTTSYAFALPPLQCPSSKQFFHESQRLWLWRGKNSYPNWFFKASDAENNNLWVLPTNDLDLEVMVAPSFQAVTCRYGSDSQRSTYHLKEFEIAATSPVPSIPKNLPSSFSEFKMDFSGKMKIYQCHTQASSPEKCSWSMG